MLRYYLEPSISHRRQSLSLRAWLRAGGGGASGWEPSGEGGVCSATPAAGRQAGLPATPPEQRQAVMWSPRPRRGSSVCLPPQTEQHTAGVSLKASPGLQDGFKMQTSARHARDCFTFMDCLRSSHDSNSNTKILMTHFLYRLVVEDTAGSRPSVRWRLDIIYRMCMFSKCGTQNGCSTYTKLLGNWIFLVIYLLFA